MEPSVKPAADLFDLPAIEREEPAPPPDPSSPLPWRRLTVVYVAAFGGAVLFRFPAWALLALPLAALAAHSVRRLRWPYRVASAAVCAAYLAQISAIVVLPVGWGSRFVSAFLLLLAAACCWGLQADDL